MEALVCRAFHRIDGAGDVTRTRDSFLGKEGLYQLSYTRANLQDALPAELLPRRFLFIPQAPCLLQLAPEFNAVQVQTII